MKSLIFAVLVSLMGAVAQAGTLLSGDSSNAILNRIVQETRIMLPPQLFVMIGDSVTVNTSSSFDADVCARNVRAEDLAAVDTWGRKRISVSASLLRKISQSVSCADGRDLFKLAQTAIVQKLARMYDVSPSHWSNPTDRTEIRRCELKYPNDNRINTPSLSAMCEYYFKSRGKISTSLPYRSLSDFNNGVEDSKNRLSMRVGDITQLFSPEQHFAVNLAQFVLDSDYYCRKPAHFNYFQNLLKFTPYWNSLCKPVQYVFTSTGGWGIDLNPSRIYQVHFLFASKGEDFSSKWGHSMLRFIVCAPNRPVGPDCMKDESYHVVLSYRANVDDVIVNNWDGLTGKYPSQALFFSMPEIINEYTRGEWRELISLPLQVTKQQQDMIVQATLEHYWSYSGQYRFLSNNCAIETDQLVRMVLPRNHAYLNTHSISPLGMYKDLSIYGFINPKLVNDKEEARSRGQYYPSQKEALEKSYKKMRHLFPEYKSLEDLAQNSYAVDRHAAYEKLDSMPVIGAAYLVEKYAAMVAQRRMQITAATLLQGENADPSLRAAIAKMLEASEARLPWNLAGPGYGIPLQSEMISEAAIIGRVQRSQEGTAEYFKALLSKFPELNKEIEDVNANLELLTNLRRF